MRGAPSWRKESRMEKRKWKKTGKKIISLVMSVVMSLSVWASAIPITAYAATTDISNGYSATLYPDNAKYDGNWSNTDAVYTGEAQTVKARVYGDDPDTYLTEGTDYEISYDNNINVGEATVTITGIGSYTGTITKPLTVVPMSLTAALTASIFSCSIISSTLLIDIFECL